MQELRDNNFIARYIPYLAYGLQGVGPNGERLRLIGVNTRTSALFAENMNNGKIHTIVDEVQFKPVLYDYRNLNEKILWDGKINYSTRTIETIEPVEVSIIETIARDISMNISAFFHSADKECIFSSSGKATVCYQTIALYGKNQSRKSQIKTSRSFVIDKNLNIVFDYAKMLLNGNNVFLREIMMRMHFNFFFPEKKYINTLKYEY